MRTVIHSVIITMFFPLILLAQETQRLDQRDTSSQLQMRKPLTKVQSLVQKCYDMALAGLGDDARKTLIEAIYDSTYKEDEPYLRFALGQVCYELKEYQGAKYQWNMIYAKFPDSEEAEAVRIIFGALDWAFENWGMDQKFWQEYNLSTLFWNATTPDLRFKPEDLIDPIMALNYLQELYLRYFDEMKRAVILYDQFLIIMGYNQNNFGFHNLSIDDDKGIWGPSITYYKKVKAGEVIPLTLSREVAQDLIKKHKPKEFYFHWAQVLSDSLMNIQAGIPYYTKTQFLLGVSRCESKFLSSEIKLKKEAVPFFQNVVKSTEGDESNIYRIFALKWLSEAD